MKIETLTVSLKFFENVEIAKKKNEFFFTVYIIFIAFRTHDFKRSVLKTYVIKFTFINKNVYKIFRTMFS